VCDQGAPNNHKTNAIWVLSYTTYTCPEVVQMEFNFLSKACKSIGEDLFAENLILLEHKNICSEMNIKCKKKHE